jgi:hypothetical protein
MCPNAHADKANHRGCPHHDGVSKDGLARENRNDFRETGECRNHQDVDLRVSEDPKEMLPDHCGAAGLRVKKMPAEITIDQQHDLRT